MKTYLLILLSLFASQILAQETSVYDTLILGIEDDTITLEPDLAYFYFSASDKYLSFYEAYTSRIHFFDIENKDIYRLDIKKGNGPFEINNIRGLVTINNTAVMLDVSNSKILTYDITKQNFTNEFLIDQYLYALATDNKAVYGKVARPDALFAIVDIESENVTPITESSNSTVAKESRTNMYRFDGNFIASENYLLSLRYYEPNFFGYNLEQETFISGAYDELEEKNDYQRNNLGFVTGLSNKLNLRLHSGSFFSQNKIALVIEGKGKKGEHYDRGNVYIYDLLNNSFEKRSISNTDHIKIVESNNDKLFIYDDEKFIIKIVDK